MKKTAASAIAAALILSAAAIPVSAQSVQSVLDRMIEAMGGRKVMGAVKDMTVTGSMEMVQMGLTAPITVYQKEPNKLRVDLDLSALQAGLNFTQAYDGTKGWGTNQQTLAIEEFSEALTKAISHQAIGNDAFLDPKKLGITYALKPSAELEGRNYIVLERTLADGHQSTFYVDAGTYLIYKTVTSNTDQTSGGLVEVESYSTDYRKVGGMMIAFSARVLSGGAESQRITIATVTFNSNLDDALFVMK